MAYHLGYLSGGFLGVDVFFVLSGYLITSLLIGEAVASERIDVMAFWKRRIRRLLPAVLVAVPVVLLTAMAVGWPTARLDELAVDGGATLTWWSNWRQVASGQSYWAPGPNPFRHAWSLSIEEQFYLAWPILVAAAVWLTARRGRSLRTTLGWAAGSAAAVSFAWHVVLAQRVADSDLSRVYLGTDTRVLAVLSGCALACSPWGMDHEGRSRWLWLVGSVGATVLVVLSVVAGVDDPWMFRGGVYGLVALCSAALVALVAATPNSSAEGAGGRARPGPVLAYLGTRSYGLYLWSWPIQVLAQHRWPDLDRSLLVGFVLATTLVVTEVSYRLIEQPIRRGRGWASSTGRRAPAWVLGGLGSAAVVLLVAQAATPPPAHERIDTAEALADATGRPTPADSSRSGLRVLVVGDSVAFTVGYYKPADDELPTGIESIDSRAVIGCGVLASAGWDYEREAGGFGPPAGGYCVGQARGDAIGLQGSPDLVVILPGAWEHLAARSPGGKVVPARSEAMHDVLVASFVDRAAAAHTVGARLVLVEWACPGSGTPPERRDPEYIRWIGRVMHDAAETASDRGLEASVLPAGEQTCAGGATGRPSSEKRKFMGDSNHVLGFAEGRLLWRDWLGPALVALEDEPPS